MSDMTSAVAIDLLDNLIGMIEDNQENDYDEAFRMAINALKAQDETHEERTETHACDCISRQAAIDFIDAGHLCNPNEPRWSDNEVVNFLKSRPSAKPDSKETSSTQKALDTISRQAAIDALWKALYEYEDKMEKQFIESEELDVCDWFLHRIFVQNMSDIDRQTILDMPSAQPETHEERTETHACDCIERQAAIEALMEILDKPNHAEFLYTDEICKTLNNLPSAQPERKKEGE